MNVVSARVRVQRFAEQDLKISDAFGLQKEGYHEGHRPRTCSKEMIKNTMTISVVSNRSCGSSWVSSITSEVNPQVQRIIFNGSGSAPGKGSKRPVSGSRTSRTPVSTPK